MISFVAVAFFLFLIIEAYNRMRPADADVAAVTEVGMLTEIRDLLAQRQ